MSCPEAATCSAGPTVLAGASNTDFRPYVYTAFFGAAPLLQGDMLGENKRSPGCDPPEKLA